MVTYFAKRLRTLPSLAFAFILLLGGATLPAHAAEPTLQEIAAVARSGKLEEAQKMAGTVLKAHPTSAKAYFVNAELLARTGRQDEARAALAQAESLAPGLPFARPDVVAQLHKRLGTSPGQLSGKSESGGGMNWLLIAAVVPLILLVVMLGRGRSRPKDLTRSHHAAAGSDMASHLSPEGQRQGYRSGGEPREGMGSTLARGLATGAALGAGLVAGEALAKHFTEDDAPQTPLPDESLRSDLGIIDQGGWDSGGGDDFGVDDSGGDWS